MTTSSSSAVEKKPKVAIWKRFIIFFVIVLIFFILYYLNHQNNSEYVLKTLELNGSVKDGYVLFKTNCVGCHGITARGLVGPD